MAPDRSRLVVVLSNFNKERGVMLSQTGQLPSEAKSVYTYTTTADKHLKQAQFNVRDQVFVDPYSTTTIVYNF
jgi:hypothetical protein